MNPRKRKSIADHMLDILNENEETIVWYGSLNYIHKCAERAGLYERGDENYHSPFHINNRVLTALGRSQYFTKGYVKHIGRPARAFEVKPEYSTVFNSQQILKRGLNRWNALTNGKHSTSC